jgi:hypothetical protein
MAKYTASLTVALTAETAEAIYQAALEEEVGPSVMGRKLIEDGLFLRRTMQRAGELHRQYLQDINDDSRLQSGTG